MFCFAVALQVAQIPMFLVGLWYEETVDMAGLKDLEDRVAGLEAVLTDRESVHTRRRLHDDRPAQVRRGRIE